MAILEGEVGGHHEGRVAREEHLGRGPVRVRLRARVRGPVRLRLRARVRVRAGRGEHLALGG